MKPKINLKNPYEIVLHTTIIIGGTLGLVGLYNNQTTLTIGGGGTMIAAYIASIVYQISSGVKA